jgi:hypothetical protein
MSGSAGEQASDGAAAGTDLKHRVLGNVAERSDDATAGICIYQEVLAEPGFLLHFSKLCHERIESLRE